jgi:hypothetical protein
MASNLPASSSTSSSELKGAVDMRLRILLLFWVRILLLPLPLSAQWSTDPSHNLQVSPWGLKPDACSDGNGGVYITWVSFDYRNSKVYLQRVNKYGYVQWNPPLYVGDIHNFQQGGAKVIEDGRGNVIVCYSELVPVDTFSGTIIYIGRVRVHKVDSLGHKLWPSDGVRVSIDSTDQGFGGLFNVVSDSAGGAIIQWMDRDSLGVDSVRQQLQRISAVGQRLWGGRGVHVANISARAVGESSLARDGNNGAIIHYWTGSERVFQRLNAQGDVVWRTLSPNYFRTMVPDRQGGVVLSGLRDSNGGDVALGVNRLTIDGVFRWGHKELRLPIVSAQKV